MKLRIPIFGLFLVFPPLLAQKFYYTYEVDRNRRLPEQTSNLFDPSQYTFVPPSAIVAQPRNAPAPVSYRSEQQYVEDGAVPRQKKTVSSRPSLSVEQRQLPPVTSPQSYTASRRQSATTTYQQVTQQPAQTYQKASQEVTPTYQQIFSVDEHGNQYVNVRPRQPSQPNVIHRENPPGSSVEYVRRYTVPVAYSVGEYPNQYTPATNTRQVAKQTPATQAVTTYVPTYYSIQNSANRVETNPLLYKVPSYVPPTRKSIISVPSAYQSFLESSDGTQPTRSRSKDRSSRRRQPVTYAVVSPASHVEYQYPENQVQYKQTQVQYQQPETQIQYQQPVAQVQYQQPQTQTVQYEQPQSQLQYQQPQRQVQYVQPKTQVQYQEPQRQVQYVQPKTQVQYQEPQKQVQYQQPQTEVVHYQQPQAQVQQQQQQQQQVSYSAHPVQYTYYDPKRYQQEVPVAQEVSYQQQTPSSSAVRTPQRQSTNTYSDPRSTYESDRSYRQRTSHRRRSQVQHTPKPKPSQFATLPPPVPIPPPAYRTEAATPAPRPLHQATTHRPAQLAVAQLPPDTDDDGIPGQAGVDYPTLNGIPATSFSCGKQPLGGYYADLETSCQVVHICQNGGIQDSFLCPNGTIWNQEKFACQWWYEVNCADSAHFYALNENLYKIPPPSPVASKKSARGKKK